MDYGVPDQNVAVYGEDEPQYEGHYNAEEGNYGSIDNIDDSAGIKHDSSSSAGLVCVSLVSCPLGLKNMLEIENALISLLYYEGWDWGFGLDPQEK